MPAALPSAPAAVIFRAARTPITKQKRIFIPVLCAPGPPTRPANGPGPPMAPPRRPDPAFGGRFGLRRAPGRTPTSDP